MEISEISNIGSKIRKERRSQGFSQSELSKKLDIYGGSGLLRAG